MAILRHCAEAVARRVGPRSQLVELGSGASKKIRLLLEALRPARYLGVDISREFLLDSTNRLARDYPWLQRWIDAFDTFGLGYLQHSYDEAGAALMRAIDRVVYDGMSAQETADLLQIELERLE